jgi:putative transposase
MLAVQVDVGNYSKPVTENRRDVIGVDLGVKHLAVLSTGEKVEGPKALVQATKKLVRLSRNLSRKVKKSNNRYKAKQKLARLHLRIADVRKDAMNKLTTRLLRENETVVVEDLNVQSMGKLRSLSRRVADQAFGEFRRQLTYKAPIFGAKLVVASRWFPSSKMCSACGKVKAELLLSQREYVCDWCGFVGDRDINAAMNLEKLGQAMPEVMPVDKKALAMSQDKVKPSRRKQESRSEHLCTLKG